MWTHVLLAWILATCWMPHAVVRANTEKIVFSRAFFTGLASPSSTGPGRDAARWPKLTAPWTAIMSRPQENATYEVVLPDAEAPTATYEVRVCWSALGEFLVHLVVQPDGVPIPAWTPPQPEAGWTLRALYAVIQAMDYAVPGLYQPKAPKSSAAMPPSDAPHDHVILERAYAGVIPAGALSMASLAGLWAGLAGIVLLPWLRRQIPLGSPLKRVD
ncbi:hypothetical protein CXG81DRAFT_23992 [Caulochytrium protostelioides]|uniref:Uncharacterized protein n=1 Tax=Caulochytrium protostelioides TaxID=1555241 RepID=A0A4P9XCZ0_9FUNG|nr:hypothetical protein CXG81DRAFT_23992 [Caulochytrium protostelioides]|eukprot:RKP03336.1 hypothetical protein CXG81DRAFT_23992 [Caulochytrium protostelioides]